MINIGDINISDLYVGTSHVSKVYVGEDQVWPVGGAYITFKALADNSVVGLDHVSEYQTLEYSLDTNTWSTLDDTVTIDLDTDDEVYVRGVLSGDNDASRNTQFSITGQVSVSGNCNALWDYNDLHKNLHYACGYNLFKYCTGLVDAHDLIIPMSNSQVCYAWAFCECSNLVSAPRLTSTSLGSQCYYCMFENCSSLTSVPSLPATSLAYGCYIGMFFHCTGLTSLLENLLPATTLAESCYEMMFYYCTGLTSLPENLLPATTLERRCYARMFHGCSNITSSPILPATTLEEECYSAMFTNCPNLTQVTCYAADNTATDCTDRWLQGVSSTGMFLTPDSSIWLSGDSGIPTNWTSQVPEYINYLTFDIIEGGDIVWKKYTVNKTIEYSINNGTWVSLPATTDGAHITAAAGDEIRFRGNNTSYATSKSAYCAFEGVDQGLSGAKYNVRGNIMSLCYGDNFIGNDTLPADYTFCSLFKYSRVVSAKDLVLPALTMVPDCYRAMFSFAELLEEAPSIPATTTALECCWYMFESTIITKSPDLLTQVLAEKCYGNMFNNCAQLNSVKCLATDISAANCIQNWMTGVGAGGTFYRDSSLTWPRGTAGVPMSWTIVPSQS